MVSWRHQLWVLEHHSLATIHVNSFTMPSGNFEAGLRKLGIEQFSLPPPTPIFPPRSRGLPHPSLAPRCMHPGTPVGQEVLTEVCWESCSCGPQGWARKGQRSPGHTSCWLLLSTSPRGPGFANRRASPIWSRGAVVRSLWTRRPVRSVQSEVSPAGERGGEFRVPLRPGKALRAMRAGTRGAS